MKLFVIACACLYAAVALVTLACVCLGPWLKRDDTDDTE
jgi:hypothetical protein